jgi:hypothetical protein
MIAKRFKTQMRYYFLAILCITMLIAPASVMASPPAVPPSQGPWWEVTPEPENPSTSYDSILYSEIAPKLREIEVNSNRVKVEVIGQSAGGRNLFLVTLSSPEAMGRLGQYQAIRQTMLKDPEKAQEMIDQFGDFKVPVFINGSIHGNEYTGVDAAIRLIETLAYEDTEEVRAILDNVILLVNVVQNPDGRVMGTRGNANGFDLNRDFITQSQPEVRATVRVFTEWNPMVVLDLHGFTNPMLIEPCTPPHNPNYEYDLYIKWAFQQAEAMEAELKAQTGFDAQIPFRDFAESWDDWPPIFAPMYAMYHGSYGHTLETPYRDVRGVDAHYAAVWGALKFISQNRQAMVRDQVEIFKRGFLDVPQVAIPQYILDQTPYNQYNELTTIDFPAAYVIPAQSPLQQSPYEAARLVDFLLRNDVQVEQASEAFTLGDINYPKGTYVVWMNQPKRGLANTVLWAGWDISYDPGLTMYDISGWSHPLLWGVSRAVMEESLDLNTHTINKADTPQGSAEGGKAGAYAYLPTSNVAVRATNDLLARGVTLYRAEEPFADSGRDFGAGTFVLPADQADARSIANELANQYGLDVFALNSAPEGATLMHKQRIAVYADEGVEFFLKQFGFDYTPVSTSQLNAGILISGGYDTFINSNRSYSGLNAAGKDALAAFIAGGGDYIGIGRTGVPFAVDANLLNVGYLRQSSQYNGVVRLNYNPADPVAAQYPEDSHGFVYGPVWFTSWADGIDISAYVGDGEFFVSGYWPGWDTSGAAGQPIILHGTKGSAEVTLVGINPTFRAHPEGTFRILANAIYNGLD